ncbi:MAG TPA: cysteine synthase [Steroidobacteraceae bacterium]|nr:cysteine synthase [Steroidobacteraceae bacterium]
MSRFNNVLETIGNTPIVRLTRLAPAGVELFVKLEARNPMGSVKDRLALAIIEDAEARGALRPGQTVVEATSGNTGIALAMVCAARGYPLVVVMAENFSIERRRLMRFLGARVVLTPAVQKGSGMMRKAAELAAKHGWFLCRQFDNPANPAMHERTTGAEILAAFADAPLHWFVAGCGTGGTVTGVGRALRRAGAATRIAVCEPDNSPMLAGGVPQARDAAGAPLDSHPAFRPHPMQGWSPDFIAGITETAVREALIERILPVNGADAMHCARELARREGIFCGITSGATLAGALQLARDAAPGTRILALLPDTGERYQSTPLFADIPTDMTGEELEISRSTPSGRFDAVTPAPGVVAALAPVPQGDAGASSAVAAAIGDRSTPVVMFALEWCEFSWSVRRLFARLSIPFRSIDLDAKALQPDDLGARMRAALSARTGLTSIPQIFVGGELVGGATDVIEAAAGGTLQARLVALDVPFARDASIDPRAFLPNWVQPR